MKSFVAIVAACVVCACAGKESSQPKLVTLSPDGVRNIDIVYSPDGSHIAYLAPVAGEAAGWQLWVANADLSSPKSLPITTLFTGNLAVWSPDGATIAVLSSDFGAASVAVVPAAGGTARRITRGPGIQVPIEWNRDGDRVAYFATNAGNYTALSVSAKTAIAAPLVPGETRPHIGNWSSDGSRVGYNVFDSARTTFWIADSAGKSPRQLTTEGFEQPSRNTIQWSPDGKEILYESRRTGTTDLWIVSVGDGKARQLTRDVRNDYAAAWSSDGKWIVFLSDRGRQVDVWVVPSAGGPEIRVTDTPNNENAPTFRPRTHEVAFVMATQKSSMWSRSIADGKEVQLTPDSIRSTWFNVSPDGKMVNYTVERGGGTQDLLVMPAAGGPSRTLVSGGGSVTFPLWSPDGSKIVFVSDRGGTQDVWVVDAAGGAARQIENWPGFESSAAWSGDGSSILFVSDRDAKLGDIWKVPAAGGEPVRVTHDGTVNTFWTRNGVADALVQTISRRGGQFAASRVRPDGTLSTVWEKTNVFPQSMSPSGDDMTGLVEQPDGKSLSMIISMKSGTGRVVLKPNEQTLSWSPDGKSMLVSIATGGTADLGIMNLADGSVKRLMTTPESEVGPEWGPDGKTVFFQRRTTVQRIVTTDLAKFLK